MPPAPATWSAAPFVPESRSLSALRRAAAGCRGCPLWEKGTQTVFGEGPRRARYLFIGEQPGDREDLAGRPFVGPAGRLLDDALQEAGIARDDVYLTNAVKHFKWVPAGQRRLHKKPGAREIAACRPWLDAEIAAVQPELLVALGATAAQALLGPDFRVTRDRGRRLPLPGAASSVVATVHPASILRGRPADRAAALAAFIADLRQVSGR